MSEVIVRMKMPTGCANCPMADDESRFCKAAKEYIPMLGRPSWCPIIGELPEQHGDLIDRELLFRDIVELIITRKGTLSEVIEKQKAVIAAERKDNEQTRSNTPS